jgi:ASC-1-like (ASCH) protein
MKLKPEPFEVMKKGLKDIEMRLYDDKRQQIKVGDIIEFKNTESGEILKTEVLCLHQFPSFKDLYKAFDKSRLGYYENEIANPNDMEKYYPVDEINQFGVVGIEIKII